MKIALDYDGTITEDVQLWVWFVQVCRTRGHDVRVVTFRAPEDLTGDMVDFQQATEDWDGFNRIPIIFTDRTPKREYCKSIDWEPDLWIDDHPDLIIQGSDWSPEEHAAWKDSIKEDLVTV